MAAKSSFHLITLGCKVNQYESQSLREAWLAHGLDEMTTATARTVCINTCAVTANAVADGRAAVRRAHRENPDAEIIVTGCAAEVLAKEFRDMPGVILVVPQTAKAELLRYAETFPQEVCVTPDKGGAANDATSAYPPYAIAGYERSRAVLKVQDGCSHRCTYCIVPLTRGRSRSRRPEETLAEARRLLATGFRELVLNGINLAQYGRDFADPADFWDLTAFLENELAPEWKGRARIRLSSLEPGQLGPRALDVLGSSSLVAPQLHLSLQSGSKNVLRRMGRGHYDPNILEGFCRDLARVIPRFGLGADILSGFPGETEADAGETEALCQTLPFSYAHVFPYSRRPGTPAATWKDQVPHKVKKERAARLRAIFTASGRRFLEGCLTLPTVTIACEVAEKEGKRVFSGVNEFYTECRFMPESEPDADAHRKLILAEPVFADDGFLWVKAR